MYIDELVRAAFRHVRNTNPYVLAALEHALKEHVTRDVIGNRRMDYVIGSGMYSTE